MFGNQRHDSPGQIFVTVRLIFTWHPIRTSWKEIAPHVIVKVNLLSICSWVSQAAGFMKRRAPQVCPALQGFGRAHAHNCTGRARFSSHSVSQAPDSKMSPWLACIVPQTLPQEAHSLGFQSCLCTDLKLESLFNDPNNQPCSEA